MKERTLHPGQRLLIEDKAHTEHLIVAGIRYGKSFCGPAWHYYRVKKNAAQGAKLSLVTAPDYKLAKQVCLTYYKNFLVASGLNEGNYGDFRINKSDLTIYFNRHDHTVLTLSGETPDKIIAYTSSHAWNDEAARSSKEVRDNLIQRNSFTCDHQQLLHTTTPLGSEHWLFDVFGPHKVPRIEGTQHSISDKESKIVLHGRTMDNPYLSRKYIATLKRSFEFDTLYYANHILGEWVSLSRNRFYFKYDETKHVGDFPPKFTTPHLYLSFDNNVGNLAVVAMQPNAGGTAVVWANECDAENIPVACEQFLRAFPPGTWGSHYLTIYGDAVLWDRSNQTHTTGFQLIRSLLQPHFPKLEVRAPRSNPLIHDRSIVTNRVFGEDRLKIHRNCKKVVLSARTTQTTKEGKVKKDSKDIITHPMEAVDRVLAATEGLLINRRAA
ncbi:phage terminase large subunit [Isosphaeraceae bacterium EP7]